MNVFVEREPTSYQNLKEVKEYNVVRGNACSDVLLCHYFIDKQKRLQGLFERYDDRGHLVERGVYKDGQKDGIWRTYYPNGDVEAEFSYRDGKRHGLCKRYFSGNRLAEEFECQNGEIYGWCREFHPTQTLRSEGFRCCNGRYGVWNWYDEKGALVKKSCFDGAGREVRLYRQNTELSNDIVRTGVTVRRETIKVLGIVAALNSRQTVRLLQRRILNTFRDTVSDATNAQQWDIRNGARVRQ